MHSTYSPTPCAKGGQRKTTTSSTTTPPPALAPSKHAVHLSGQSAFALAEASSWRLASEFGPSLQRSWKQRCAVETAIQAPGPSFTDMRFCIGGGILDNLQGDSALVFVDPPKGSGGVGASDLCRTQKWPLQNQKQSMCRGNFQAYKIQMPKPTFAGTCGTWLLQNPNHGNPLLIYTHSKLVSNTPSKVVAETVGLWNLCWGLKINKNQCWIL